jgi:hypothetical protein
LQIAEVMATYRNYIRTIAVNALMQMPYKETQIKTGMYSAEGKLIKDPTLYQPVNEAHSIGRLFLIMLKESIRTDMRRYNWEESFVSLLASGILECYGTLKANKPKEAPEWFYEAARVEKVYSSWKNRMDKDKLKAQRNEWMRSHMDTQANESNV